MNAENRYRPPTNTTPKNLRALPAKKELYLAAAQILAFIMICGTVWGILRQEELPVKQVFGLILLVITAVAFGKLMKLIYLPPLLGMMIAGFLFRNTEFMDYDDEFSVKSSTILRNLALVIVLLKAGLGICPETLKEMKLFIFRLSFIPSIVETGISAVCTHYFLEMPWTWALMLGFLLCAVSPAIVVPCTLAIIDKKYGIDQGIPTLAIAAVSVDAIIAITGFGIFFGVSLTKGNLVWLIVKGPLEVVVGIAYGFFIGFLMWFVPNDENEKQVFYRVLLMIFGGTAIMFLSNALHFKGAGALGCISLAFVSALNWRNDEIQFPTISTSITTMWHFLEPFLFSLIGREISIDGIKADAGYGILSIILAIAVRFAITPLIVYGANLNMKEKVFLAIIGIPKATVQAAMGSVALDYTRVNHLGHDDEENSLKVLTLAVLSILITAPLGSLLIPLTAPVLLRLQHQPSNEDVIFSTERDGPAGFDKIRTQVSINKL